jgi:hypothetical protein
VAAARPEAVLLGGDLLPHPFAPPPEAGATPISWHDFLQPRAGRPAPELGDRYPRWLVIPGNDDPRALEPQLKELAADGLWDYLPGAWSEVGGTAGARLSVRAADAVPPEGLGALRRQPLHRSRLRRARGRRAQRAGRPRAPAAPRRSPPTSPGWPPGAT